MVAQLLNKKWRAGWLTRPGVASARGYDARAVRPGAHMPKLKILVIRVLYIHTGILLLHLRPACEGAGRHRAEQGVASF
jgi:hypothetical protein